MVGLEDCCNGTVNPNPNRTVQRGEIALKWRDSAWLPALGGGAEGTLTLPSAVGVGVNSAATVRLGLGLTVRRQCGEACGWPCRCWLRSDSDVTRSSPLQDFKISRFQDFKISRFQDFKISRFHLAPPGGRGYAYRTPPPPNDGVVVNSAL